MKNVRPSEKRNKIGLIVVVVSQTLEFIYFDWHHCHCYNKTANSPRVLQQKTNIFSIFHAFILSYIF
jgi:hypothetical protein